MAQASGQSGIPLSCLKYLKRHGCPCFKFHRVYERGLQKYVDDYIWNNRAFWIGGRMKERLRESKAALKRMYPDWKP